MELYTDEEINLGSPDDKVLGITLGADDGITRGLDEGTELGFSDESCDGSNDGKLEVVLIGDSLETDDGT